MKQLKIDPELRDFIPPLSGEEKVQLEDSLLKYGYKGAPIYIWRDYIVDGHNRYELCQKHNIEFSYEELDLGENATIVDVMEWMINTQLGRRNLPPAQRLRVLEKFKQKLQEEAKEKASESRSNFHGNQYQVVSSPNGEHTKIRTDKELAKMAGVGTGTVARYNQIMKSDDEALKKKVLSNDIKINTAYEQIKKKQKNSQQSDKTENEVQQDQRPKTYQEASKLYGGKQQGHLPNRKQQDNNTDIFTEEQLVNALVSSKTPVNVFDAIIPKQEFDIMSETLLKSVESCNYRIFNLHEVYKKMDYEDIDYAYKKFEEVIDAISALQDKILNIHGENNNEKE